VKKHDKKKKMRDKKNKTKNNKTKNKEKNNRPTLGMQRMQEGRCLKVLVIFVNYPVVDAWCVQGSEVFQTI